MSKIDTSSPLDGTGRHTAEFCAAMQKAYGFLPSLRVVRAERSAGLGAVKIDSDGYGARLVFPLEAQGFVGEMVVAVANDGDTLPGRDVLMSIVPLAKKMLETEVEDRRLRAQIDELNKRNARLEKRTRHDPQTGLLNGKAFREAVEARMADIRPGAPAALMLLDIDNFKTVNDTLGHAFGDRFLENFAATLSHVTRSEDLVGRLGGDEFGMFMDRLPMGTLFLRELDARIRRNFSTRMGVLGHGALARVSLGVAEIDRQGIGYTTLFEAADSALYVSKSKGRNQMTVAERL